MNGLRSTIRCAAVTLAAGAALAPTAAAEDCCYTEFSNFVSVTKVRLQRRACDAADWVTMDARPSQDGFHEQQELDYTRRDVTRGRGW